MSNNESHPLLVDCRHEDGHTPSEIQIVPPKQVELGAPGQGLGVRRTLPSLQRSFVGAWCFVDHYGPELVAGHTGMDVAPHPHTSLQTVSWLFDGEIEHRDSSGVHSLVRPGEVNLMTSGHGIAHSEVSTPQTTFLHGVQLWVVLPEGSADMEREFQHHRPDVISLPEVDLKVMIGSLAGGGSPIHTETGLLGAEVVLKPGATWEVEVDPGFEHGVLVDSGIVELDGCRLERDVMGVREAGLGHLRLANPTDSPARLMLLGGEPFDEGIVMWWNFIGRSHDDIVRLRAEWEADDDRFGVVQGYRGALRRLPAPELPPLRLKRRFRHGRQ
ncbi:MAG: pirin family protein [Micropruina sp.]